METSKMDVVMCEHICTLSELETGGVSGVRRSGHQTTGAMPGVAPGARQQPKLPVSAR
jgi:hypothetical protein